MSGSSFPLRMLRAACLDSELYEEVEADRSSLGQASGVVALACASGALGRWIYGTYFTALPGDAILYDAALDVLEPLLLWLGGSAFAYMVGATFLRGPETSTDYTEVLRTTGFAFTPALLRSLGWLLPGALGVGVLLTTHAWVLVAGIVAVRQALDFTTGRAIGTYGSAYLLLWLVLRGLDASL